jgi:hypothetical protein
MRNRLKIPLDVSSLGEVSSPLCERDVRLFEQIVLESHYINDLLY